MCEGELKAYMLFSSSKGNAAYVKCGKDEILIDAGVSARRICAALADIGTSIKNIRAIFVTHEHNDHINGLATIAKYYKIPIYAPYLSAKHIAECQPETEAFLIENDDGSCVSLDNMRVCAIETPHDSLSSVGFRIDLGGKTLGYATDIGHLNEKVEKILLGCDYVVIESNHDLEMLHNGDYPAHLKRRILSRRGHLSNSDCASFLPKLVESGAKKIVLAHLSENNNRPQIAYGECRGRLSAFGINVSSDGCGGDVCLSVALPTGAVKII
ncbi:MAG TPA: MBL fold metallo-hydrolase [Bacillota bacterium]|nr:MBL fold metallo-hydrolase [Bacillota bacterium]